MARKDPQRNFRFRVEIEDIGAAGFTEVTGLSTESEIIEYREGSDQAIVRKLPGLTKVPNVVLKRGFTDSLELWEWRKQVMDGDIQRRTVRIVLIDEAGSDGVAFEIRDAWPAKYEASDLHAEGNDVVIETLELAHEGLERES